MAPTTLTDLPPELLDHITAYLPTARSLVTLGKTNKSLHAYVEKDGWRTFTRTRFSSLSPVSPPSYRDAARTLASLSKAWDRRAFLARYIEPGGDLRTYPGGRHINHWKRPKGQTIGFIPQLDVFEDIGMRWQDRKEVMAFSAGAEVCVRTTKRRGDRQESVHWMTYRPLSAYEGRDDVTTLHLLRPSEHEKEDGRQRLISGTANGDLWILTIPEGKSGDVPTTYFTTQGQAVRSSSLLQQSNHCFMAANTGDFQISLYPVDPDVPKIAPLSSIDISMSQTNRGHQGTNRRVWSTQLLSTSHLAVGIGPSAEPIHIYAITPSGIEKTPTRKFKLQNELQQLAADGTRSNSDQKSSSAIYPIVPLPPSLAGTGSSNSDGTVFLSGAYDGIIRLHDLRSNHDVETSYSDPTDDNAIYALLPRGRETLVAGASRHSLLKVFDMRMGAKCYYYQDSIDSASSTEGKRKPNDWNAFLKPHNTASNPGARYDTWAMRRSHESSVYSLASPSSCCPYIYAGLENAVVELSFTSILDQHPDPTFFSPWHPARSAGASQQYQDHRNGHRSRQPVIDDNCRGREVLGFAMYDQTPDTKLCKQRSLWETWQSRACGLQFVEGLDERWRVGSV
ncbi:hypothetical protein M433DRAFT_132146 [Acidomyces richmondensis BFW]|nr:MAG: hypothetical protein FE78DRAFT_71088 [Acidomyces sp. 'richmondensis']KYG48380.1 hypothetical protein M433DRAFT_132146 [Acidomyces richmondensis BFW]